MSHPLDNPAWEALQTDQRVFGDIHGDAARYRPSISPIAALGAPTKRAYADLAELTQPGEIVATFADDVDPGSAWQRLAGVELSQWTCPSFIENSPRALAWVDLDESHAGQMYDLAKAADPGPFERETHVLGDYVGVFDGDQLVAMAGERICFDGYREVSAVSTREGYEGRGYAKALVAEIVRRQRERDAVPFLHVRIGSPAEHAARRVYETLGFVLRAELSMHVLKRL